MDQTETYINKVKNTIEDAQEALLEIKIITENDPTHFSFAMEKLSRLEDELPNYLQGASPEQREELLEAKKQLHYTKEVMVRGI